MPEGGSKGEEGSGTDADADEGTTFVPGFETLGFDALDFDALDLDTLDLEALDFVTLDFEVVMLGEG